jgi:putative flippase GtrA
MKHIYNKYKTAFYKKAPYLEKYHSFFLYCLIGLSGATLDFLAFLFLSYVIGTDETIAGPSTNIVGIVNNFIWNTIFNFKTRDKYWLRFILFLLIGGIGIIITAGIMYLFHDILGIDGRIVKAGSIVFIAIVQYFLNKNITYKI